jgi:hypothetical protein
LDSIILSQYIPDSLKAPLYGVFGGFPNLFNLPEGGNLNYLFAGVPQFEIGSLYGTELLVRFIPPVNMGDEIGDFAFWGFGLKHSISQYFNKGDEPGRRYFDAAIQIVYQGTHLDNKIGVTNAELKANATMMSYNLQASKHIEGWLDIYTGFSYETININSDYTYYLPIEVQWQLGLIDPKAKGGIDNTEPTPGHPGDQNPQKAIIKLNDDNIKWTIGLSRDIGPITLFADFNISKFNIFTGGIIYNF